MGQCAFDLAHWYFAIKYWNLSIKMLAVINQKDDKKYNKITKVIFYLV